MKQQKYKGRHKAQNLRDLGETHSTILYNYKKQRTRN